MKERVTKNRINVEVDEEFLIELKKRALNRHMTLKRFVTAILFEYIVKEDQFKK